MDAFEMVRLLKARRNAILESLPENLLPEFLEIEAAIRQIDLHLQQHGQQVDPPIPSNLSGLAAEQGHTKGTRQPLTTRKKVLIDFLKERGPATRAEILAGTNIPTGTLSALLADAVFQRGADGRWTVKGKDKPAA